MKRNEPIAPINYDQKGKKKSVSIRHSNCSTANITLPKLQQPSFSSTCKTVMQLQKIRPQTGKNEKKIFASTCIVDSRKFKKLDMDNFMKSARRVDYNCKSLTTNIKQVDDLDQSDDPDFVPEYIDGFVRGLMSNDAAFKIQSRFRLYIEKKNWKG